MAGNNRGVWPCVEVPEELIRAVGAFQVTEEPEGPVCLHLLIEVDGVGRQDHLSRGACNLGHQLAGGVTTQPCRLDSREERLGIFYEVQPVLAQEILDQAYFVGVDTGRRELAGAAAGPSWPAATD